MAQHVCPTRSRVPHGRGFSILELVMVTTIVAVVAAITIPRLQNAATTSRLAAVERLIYAEIEQLVDDAFANDRVLTLSFNIATDTITIKDDDAGTPDVVIDLRSDAYGVDLLSADADGLGSVKTTINPRSDHFPGVTTFTIGAGSSTRVVAGNKSAAANASETLGMLADRSPGEMSPTSGSGGSSGSGGGTRAGGL